MKFLINIQQFFCLSTIIQTPGVAKKLQIQQKFHCLRFSCDISEMANQILQNFLLLRISHHSFNCGRRIKSISLRLLTVNVERCCCLASAPGSKWLLLGAAAVSSHSSSATASYLASNWIANSHASSSKT